MTTQDAPSPWLLPLVFVLFFTIFPLFWCAVVWLIAQLSGWGSLAQVYRTKETPSGQRWSWQYGMIGWAGYNGVLILTTNEQGLFMETMWLFSFGNPRIFIPWCDFHEVKAINYFFRRLVRANIGFPSKATVRLPATVFEQSAGRKLLPSQSPSQSA